MRVGVVSDTHGHLANTRDAVRMLHSLDVNLVLHCGDIGSVEVVDLFAPWPTHFVFGNVDYDRPALERAIEAAGLTCHDRFGTLELSGRKLAWLHGGDERLLEETICSGTWDLVCHGHTHVARLVRQGPTLVLNPGAVYRANPHTVAWVDLPSLAATTVAIH